MKQILWAMVFFLLLFIAAVCVEDLTLVSVAATALMPVCVYKGELWECREDD